MEKLVKILDWLNKYLAAPFNVFAGVLGILWEKDFAGYVLAHFPQRTGLHDLLSDYIPPAFMTCFVLGCIFSCLRVFTQKTISSLDAELSVERAKVDLVANNIENLVNGILLRLSERLNFARGEPSRLTIYIHNNNGHFISFGRYSPDPSFQNKGRSLLPDNEGCISRAWSADWCYEGSLFYKDARRKYSIVRETYAPQRMKSVFFAVKRIESSNRQPLAVLVVESKTPSRFPEQQIKDILESQESYLADIIHCLKDHIPDPQVAATRGF